MYKCLNCKSEFDIPAKHREIYDEPLPFAETTHDCPSCNGDYKELKYCTYCHGEIDDTYTELPDGNIGCSECLKVKSVYDVD